MTDRAISVYESIKYAIDQHIQPLTNVERLDALEEVEHDIEERQMELRREMGLDLTVISLLRQRGSGVNK